MTHRRLPDQMRVYRLGDPAGAFPIYNGEGARRFPGRWHRQRQAVIYTSEHYSTAMLERLVHFSLRLPSNQHFIEIDIPAGTSYEAVTEQSLPGWHHEDESIASSFGSKWYREQRSAILLVPSVVARMERNVVINPAHPDAARIRPGLEQPIRWDTRLFS